jgi:hypothetical protein
VLKGRLKMKTIAALVTSLLFTLSFSSFAAEKKSAETCKTQAISEAKNSWPSIVIMMTGRELMAISPRWQKSKTRKTNHNISMYCRYGNIYKGKYRMRFIFLNDCTLMGEEIIEYANP